MTATLRRPPRPAMVVQRRPPPVPGADAHATRGPGRIGADDDQTPAPGHRSLAPARRGHPGTGVALRRRWHGVSRRNPCRRRPVSLRVERGEFVTVVGPSGCGKSTLLKIASGLLEHDARVASTSIATTSATCSRTPPCSRGAPCARNVELLAELRGMPTAERQPPSPGGDRYRRADRLRGPLPEVTVGRHEDAGVAGPHTDAAAAGVPVRRTLRRRRRDHPRAPERPDPGRCSRPRASPGCSSPTRSARPCS